MKNCRFFSLGENALTVEFGTEIDEKINRHVTSLDKYLKDHPFTGLLETVPAYYSLTVYFDILKVKRSFPQRLSAFETVRNIVSSVLDTLKPKLAGTSKLFEVPIIMNEEASPDLEFVAKLNDISPEQVIKRFLGETYRVYMLGFLPGFAYMGEIDEKIATPRKETPRQIVHAGSVGIAGRQTGIYPFDSPGGWQIIGRTEITLFAPESQTPALFQTGDSVKFYRAK